MAKKTMLLALISHDLQVCGSCHPRTETCIFNAVFALALIQAQYDELFNGAVQPDEELDMLDDEDDDEEDEGTDDARPKASAVLRLCSVLSRVS